MGVHHAPDDLLAGDEFRDLLFGIVDVLVTVRELRPELVGAAFDVSGPPSANIVDGIEGFLRSPVHGEGELPPDLGHLKLGS